MQNSWLFSHVKRSWSIGLLATLIVLVTAGSFYVLYNQFGSDIAPDSPVGYGYAISGTLCFMFAVVCYTMRRRSRKRTIGQLNAALNWHSFFAIMSIALLLMHSFGNFNTKTGTYALCGLIILTVNGFVGRALDRIMPQFITREVSKMLTAQGEDRVEVSLRELQALAIGSIPETRSTYSSSSQSHAPVFPAQIRPAITSHYLSPGEGAERAEPDTHKGWDLTPTRGVTTFFPSHEGGQTTRMGQSGCKESATSGQAGRKEPASGQPSGFFEVRDQMPQDHVLNVPWDLAYHSLELPPGDLARDELQHRFISDDKHSPPVHPDALLTSAQQVEQIWDVQRATQREQFYRYVIRYWRILHITLALLAIGLIIWHLLYVVQLLISTLLH